jgi:hypothetical protein|tara:strand:+ start:149 stop:526 length:378 start_codon:yes stop_codon:yes gene_type:complete
MTNFNFIDFYIGYPGHPMYRNTELIEDDLVRVIVQKYEMIIFTNKGDILNEPNFGGDLQLLLHETRLSAASIEGDLKAQIADYIPEIDGVGYELTVEFFDDLTRHQEYMVISFTIQGYDVYATIS